MNTTNTQYSINRAIQLCEWIAETPHQRGSINGLAAQVRHELSALQPAASQPHTDATDHLKLHAIEELCQLGYTVKDGELFPPDHLADLMIAAKHPLAAAAQPQGDAREAASPDTERLDWIQDRSVTLEIIPGSNGAADWRFRVGGLYASEHHHIRDAIDAAIVAEGGTAPTQAASAQASEPSAYTYASKQATKCAGCGEHKHTPLRIDAMGGYVCLTCIDKKLGGLLNEFGYASGPVSEGWQLSVADGHAGYGVYAHMEEYPEEGATLVLELAATTRAVEPLTITEDAAWNLAKYVYAHSNPHESPQILLSAMEIKQIIERAHGITTPAAKAGENNHG